MDIKSLLNLKSNSGLLGVEIEVEGEKLPPSQREWAKEYDGSLRGPESAEYVLRTPLSLDKTEDALDNLWDSFEEMGSYMHESYRAGVHVHLNVQDLTPKQLVTLITLYLVLEEPLMKICGESRIGNHFCLRASDAEFLIHLLSSSIEKDRVGDLNTAEIRYSALNVTSLFKYGSLEFRAMRSTKDVNYLKKWCRIIAALKKASLNFENPVEVIHGISAGSERHFIQHIFAKEADLFLIQKGLSESIRVGIQNAQEVAYSRDWAKNFKEDLNIFRNVDDGERKFFSLH